MFYSLYNLLWNYHDPRDSRQGNYGFLWLKRSMVLTLFIFWVCLMLVTQTFVILHKG